MLLLRCWTTFRITNLAAANPHSILIRGQVAIPLMTMTSARVSYLYDLMDAAYDAAAIHDQSRALGHAPIVDRNFRANHEGKANGAARSSA